MFSTMFRHEFALLFYYFFFCSLCAVFVFISILHRINHPPRGSQDCVFCVSFLSLIYLLKRRCQWMEWHCFGWIEWWSSFMTRLSFSLQIFFTLFFFLNDKTQKYIYKHIFCRQLTADKSSGKYCVLCFYFLHRISELNYRMKKIVEQYWTNFVQFFIFICF